MNLGVCLLCFGLLGVGGAASSPATAGPDAGLKNFLLYTDWYAEPEQGGFFEANAKGLYAQMGISVTIEAGAPRMPIFALVARNRAAFGTSNSNDVITAVSEGFPLVIVLAYLQRSPTGVMFDSTRPLHSFRELDGRTVMAQPASAWVRFVEKKYQIKLNVVPNTWGIGRFLSDPQHAFLQQAYVTSEPYLVQQAGRQAGMLLLFDAGFRPYRVVYSSREFVRTHPAQVRAFVAASLEGWRQYLHGDHEAADALIERQNREMNPAVVAFGREAILQYHLADGEESAGEALGRLDPGRLQQTIATLRELQVIRTAPAVSELTVP
jgi:NitT/TauT family transport system substrate-binding protein